MTTESGHLPNVNRRPRAGVLPVNASTEGGTSLMLAQSGVCFVARVIRADAVANPNTVQHGGDRSQVEIELKTDTESLEHNAARLAV